MKSPERNFDVESNISSCSKSEETTVTASAGLDMRRGEYKELEFPPVTMSSQTTALFNPILKERSPSPMDLCTIVRTKDSVKPNEVAMKFVTSSISRAPLDDIPNLKSHKPHDTRLVAAHQPKPSLLHDSQQHFGPSALLSRDTGVIGLRSTTNVMSAKVRDLSYKVPTEKTAVANYGNWESPFLRSSQGDVLSFSRISQTPKPEKNQEELASKKRHSSCTDLMAPTVQLQHNLPELTTKNMSEMAMGTSSDEGTTQNVSLFSTSGKCEFIPKSTLLSIDEVCKQKSYKSDIGSEPQEEVKLYMFTATFKPKKVQGLKLGSSISRGLYGRKRYGTGRGNVFSQNVKDFKPISRLPKNRKQAPYCLNRLLTLVIFTFPVHNIPKKSSENIPVKTSVENNNVKTAAIPSMTPPVPKNLPSNPKHGLIDRKKLAATTEKVRDNLKRTTCDDSNSTLEFDELANQQNTSNDTLDSSQIDDSKDSSYSPSKATQESSSTEQTSIDQSVQSEHDKEEDNVIEDDYPNNDEEAFVEESDEEEESGQVRAKDYLTINVPSGTLMSPKSRQKCISEYAQLIGKRGVRFSFAGNYPDIYYNPPDVQSNMKGFSPAHTGMICPSTGNNRNPTFPESKEALQPDEMPMNISSKEEVNPKMSMIEMPQSSSTPKSRNRQSNIDTLEQTPETPNNADSKLPTSTEHEESLANQTDRTDGSDPSIIKPKNKENLANDGQDGGDVSKENDSEPSTNNPNTSTLSQDSEGQSSSQSEIADV